MAMVRRRSGCMNDADRQVRWILSFDVGCTSSFLTTQHVEASVIEMEQPE